MSAITLSYFLYGLGLSLTAVLALLPITVCGFLGLVKLRAWVEDIAHETHRDLCTLALYPLVLGFLLLDTAFNWTWGSLWFRELPRECLFTSRVERHFRTCAYDGPPSAPTYVHAITRQQHTAVFWADFLNGADPGHVTMHAG